MFIKVFPIDVSFDNDGLTYFVKNNQKKYLKIGSIVSIPIKNRISFGVVASFEAEETFDNIKSIVDIICSFPVLHEYQIKLIKNLADKYFLPVHKVLNLFLPKYILSRFDNNAFQDVLNLEEKKTKTQHINELNHIISDLDIYEVVSTKINSDKIAIIIGDDLGVDLFINKLSQSNKNNNNIIVFKNSFSYSRKYKIFLEIMQAQKNIIIGTRKIIQYNLAHFDKIYYLEDSICKFLYNQNEKYENLVILEYLINLNFFNINILSSLPSIKLITMLKKYQFLYTTI